VVAAAHSTSHQDSPRDGGSLFESSRNRDAATGRMGTARAGKTGQEVTTDFGAGSTGAMEPELGRIAPAL